jgi:hypothetical protein
MMFTRIRMAVVAASSSIAMLGAVAPSAHAGLLSLTTGACGLQETEPFAQFGDTNAYVQTPGGTFEPGSASWTLSQGAKVVLGNESYHAAGPGALSLSLPAGSSASSPPACTGLDHPSARLFVRNTGSSASRLNVTATYRILLGLPVTISLGQLTGSWAWEPSTPLKMGLLDNLAGSLTLSQSTISFKFTPADNTGNWQIDDLYLDPFRRM